MNRNGVHKYVDRGYISYFSDFPGHKRALIYKVRTHAHRILANAQVLLSITSLNLYEGIFMARSRTICARLWLQETHSTIWRQRPSYTMRFYPESSSTSCLHHPPPIKWAPSLAHLKLLPAWKSSRTRGSQSHTSVVFGEMSRSILHSFGKLSGSRGTIVASQRCSDVQRHH